MLSKLELTEAAISKIRQLIVNQSESKFLRVAVVGGGCSGLLYKMELVPAKDDSDKVFTTNDISVIVDLKSCLFMKDTVIDYDGSLMGKGFSFNNAAASKSCGCGMSFSS